MDNSQKPVILPSQVEALAFLNQKFEQAELIGGEVMVGGHRAWPYHAANLVMTRDGRRRWVLDTGELFDTTTAESENTREKALAKLRMHS